MASSPEVLLCAHVRTHACTHTRTRKSEGFHEALQWVQNPAPDLQTRTGPGLTQLGGRGREWFLTAALVWIFLTNKQWSLMHLNSLTRVPSMCWAWETRAYMLDFISVSP